MGGASSCAADLSSFNQPASATISGISLAENQRRCEVARRVVGSPVTLHIYDPMWLATMPGLNTVHVGVDVYEAEFSYGEGGVRCAQPGCYPAYKKRATVVVGKTDICWKTVLAKASESRDTWLAKDYKLIGHNCQSFAIEFCKQLGILPETLPTEYFRYAETMTLPGGVDAGNLLQTALGGGLNSSCGGPGFDFDFVVSNCSTLAPGVVHSPDTKHISSGVAEITVCTYDDDLGMPIRPVPARLRFNGTAAAQGGPSQSGPNEHLADSGLKSCSSTRVLQPREDLHRSINLDECLLLHEDSNFIVAPIPPPAVRHGQFKEHCRLDSASTTSSSTTTSFEGVDATESPLSSKDTEQLPVQEQSEETHAAKQEAAQPPEAAVQPAKQETISCNKADRYMPTVSVQSAQHHFSGNARPGCSL